MFEGKLPHAATSQPLDRTAAGIDNLRPVRWPDLVAKFDAARELRTELGMGEAAGDASFDPDSARHIAELAEGKPDINLDGLANDKAADGMGRPDMNGAASDDPRK
jgi:hypothetical protein